MKAADKLQAMKDGARVVTNDAEMDEMLAIGGDVAYEIRSAPNPDRVGTKDVYVAWIEGASEPRGDV